MRCSSIAVCAALLCGCGGGVDPIASFKEMVPQQEREFIWVYETPRDPSIADIGQKWVMSNFSHEVSKVDEGDTSHVGFILCDLKSSERVAENGKWESRSPSKLEMQFEFTGGDWVVKEIIQQIELGANTARVPQSLDDADKQLLIRTLKGQL